MGSAASDWLCFDLTSEFSGQNMASRAEGKAGPPSPGLDAFQGHFQTEAAAMAHLEVTYSHHSLVSSCEPEASAGRGAKSKHLTPTTSSLRDLLSHRNPEVESKVSPQVFLHWDTEFLGPDTVVAGPEAVQILSSTFCSSDRHALGAAAPQPTVCQHFINPARSSDRASQLRTSLAGPLAPAP